MISYAITDPITLNFSTLSDDLKRFASKADMIVYRDKKTLNYTSNAKAFITEAKNHNFQKVLLHSHLSLAIELEVDGVHLTSGEFDSIEFAKAKGLFVVISTHSLEEATLAQKLGADMLTYSPIFTTPNKGKPIGTQALQELQKVIKIPIIALGGILGDEQIKSCIKSGASGFASIRYFI